MTALASPVPQLTCDDLLRPSPLCRPTWTVFDPCSRVATRRRPSPSTPREQLKSVERMVLRQLDGDMNQVRRLQNFVADHVSLNVCRSRVRPPWPLSSPFRLTPE